MNCPIDLTLTPLFFTWYPITITIHLSVRMLGQCCRKKCLPHMFQHTGQQIKRCPETEGVTPLLFELSAINGEGSTEKEI